MASTILHVKFAGFASELPAVAAFRYEVFKAVYEENRHRVYNLAFYLTDNEMTAEELTGQTFTRVFKNSPNPTPEAVDQALITELRQTMPIGTLTLDNQETVTETTGARQNVKRAVLERAVVQLPATERMIFLMHDVEGYDHARIARTIGISEEESLSGLHQARLHLRELVATIKF